MCEDEFVFRGCSWTGIFADPFLADTEIEGGILHAGISTVADSVLSMDQTMIDVILQRDRVGGGGGGGGGGGDESHIKIRTLGQKLQVAALISKNAGAYATFEDAVRLALKSICELSVVGDYVILPGGWTRKDGGHAVMHILILTKVASCGAAEGRSLALAALDGRTFTFVTCNSGDGLNFHPSSPVNNDCEVKKTYRTGLAVPDVPAWRLQDPSFLFALLKLQVRPEKSNKPECFYEVLLPYLAGDSPGEAFQKAAKAGLHGEYESPQKAGFCFVRCALVVLRYVARRIWNWEAAGAKRFLLANRLSMLQKAILQLKDVEGRGNHINEPISSSDLGFIWLAIQQCARAAGKAVSREHINDKVLLVKFFINI